MCYYPHSSLLSHSFLSYSYDSFGGDGRIDALPSSSAPLSVPTLSDVNEKDAIMMLVADLAERIQPGGVKEEKDGVVAVVEEIGSSASVTSEFVWGGDTTSGTNQNDGNVAVASRASSSSGTGGGGGGGMKALEAAEKLDRMASVLTRHELILLLTALPDRLGLKPQVRHGGRVCVGMGSSYLWLFDCVLLNLSNACHRAIHMCLRPTIVHFQFSFDIQLYFIPYYSSAITPYSSFLLSFLVGKSSAINTILGVSKSSHGVARVAVSSTPGKTKHFQTLNVSDALMLCDCPGLVFPSFMSNAGEMLCAGILPINQMRDYIEPAEVISSRVPIHLLEVHALSRIP